jgi:hypothetical protein
VRRRVAWITSAIVVAIAPAALIVAPVHHRKALPAARAVVLTPAPTTSPSSPPTTAPQVLVPWSGPVEHLFFHTLVIHPELAFTHDRLAQGFRDFFVTVDELRSILEQLDANGWTLVDIHRAANGTVRVPAGRRPFVLSEDDVNYYDYSRLRGLGWRLVLDDRGEVKVETRDDAGVHITDDDLVPLVDEFIVGHPEFSADGAKGVIAVTGYEGVFGERVNDTASPDWSASVARATAIADRLRRTGWTIASHSYGHIDFARDSIKTLERDTTKWKTIIEPIVRPTDVFIYPFGAEPPITSPVVSMLRDNGFTIICDIDIVPRITRANGVILMARRHIDGLALRQQARRLAPMFDATTVEDRTARGARP